ncbi:MAG: hypothetical protein PHS62_01165 [Patescibacteria group bacterium]|nr:hypothetical protein [Patescibacteria group bacterium]
MLSAITLPYLRKYQPNLKLSATARDLTSDIRYAQQLTITEQKVHLVAFYLELNKYEILKIDAATSTIKSVNLDSEIHFQSISGLPSNQIVFNYYGGVSNSGQIILNNINNAAKTINIKPSGYVQLEQ